MTSKPAWESTSRTPDAVMTSVKERPAMPCRRARATRRPLQPSEKDHQLSQLVVSSMS